MFVVTDLTSSPAIEGWTPVNQAVASALVGEQGEQQPLTPSSEIKQEQNQSPGEKANANNEKSAESTKRVNINTAGLVELQNIPGVGEKKAQTIIDYRNKHGAFKKVQDLTKVKGIGTKSFQKMKPFIEIGS
jgi:competence protein ComEA